MINSKIRSPNLDGIFYPADQELLKGYINELSEQSPTERHNAKAVIVPHASFDFAGPIQVAAYKRVSLSKPKKIIIIGNTSREHENAIYLSESERFQSPLGESYVDNELNESLVSCSTQIIYNDIPHLEENAIEAQLPYIHFFFPDVPIVPILFGDTQPALISILESALRISCENYDEALFIATSNLSAFSDEKSASAISMELSDSIQHNKIEQLMKILKENSNLPHGMGAIMLMLKLFGDSLSIKKLGEGTSSANELDNRIVRYGAFSLEE